jgi:NADH-quinone oxidoreductase subunit A
VGQYLPIVALAVVAILFGVLSFVASGLLAPYRPNSAKEAPYECGIVPSRDNPERFPVSFYVIAMLFIMFDIEIIFTYPYAVSRGVLGAYGFFEMAAFSAVFFVAFVYMVAKGALEWGPLKRSDADDDAANDELVAVTQAKGSFRVVGLEGRGNSGEAA